MLNILESEIPHITIAVNVAGGGKPAMSNNITDWQPMNPVSLKGTVSEVAF